MRKIKFFWETFGSIENMRLQELSDSGLSELLRSESIALVQFGTDWCAPCKRQERVLLSAASNWRGKIVLGKVNVEDWPDCAQAYQVQRNPTLCLFRSGELLARHEGFLDPAELEAFVSAPEGT